MAARGMDRPKHRRLIFLGLVLLACGALLLLGRQWTSVPDPVPVSASISTRQLVEPQPDKVEPPTIEAAAPNVAAPPSSPTPTGFRGRVIDAVTSQPVKEFEVQLIRIRRDAHTEDEPITRSFKSATGRFTWTDVAAGTWRAAVAAPGYRMFNVGEFEISEGERTPDTVMPLLRGFAVRGRVFDSSTGAGIVDASIGRAAFTPGYRSILQENSAVTSLCRCNDPVSEGMGAPTGRANARPCCGCASA